MRLLSVWLCCFACGSAEGPPRAAQDTALAGFHHITLVTGGARPGDRLPMIIGLHWSSASPEIIAPDFRGIDVPARVVLPRGKFPREDGYTWFADGHGELGEAEQRDAALRTVDELVAFLDAATRAYPTAGKPILAGASYGGDLSYLIAVHHPDRVSAAFPVAARFLVAWLPAANPCKPDCPPITALHGTDDPIVPIEGGRDAARRLIDLGFRIDFREYKGVAHDFTPAMVSDFTRAAREVLKAQR